MAVRPTDPEALHLFQLIGAPLLAVIQAEAQAAQTSAEFIQRIGFQPPATPPPLPSGAAAPSDAASGAGVNAASTGPDPASRLQALQTGGDLGSLKVAEFELQRPTADGRLVPHRVRLPVLSLFPIPLMQVKEASFDFDMRVVTRVPLADAHEAVQDSTVAPSSDFLAAERIELKGFLAGSGRRGERAVNEANIKIHVRMEQSDLPAGLSQLMQLMGESIGAQPLPPRT